jgi:hypothetical protein
MVRDDSAGRPPGHPTDEHIQLRQMIDDTRECLQQRAFTHKELLETLVRLRTQLVEHFRNEESGGYFPDVIKVAPRLQQRADALLQQHPALQEQIDGVRLIAEQSGPSEKWWRSIADEFSKFCREFDQHERDETALLQDAYNRDIGTDD